MKARLAFFALALGALALGLLAPGAVSAAPKAEKPTRRGLAFERRLDLETGGAWWRSLILRRD